MANNQGGKGNGKNGQNGANGRTSQGNQKHHSSTAAHRMVANVPVFQPDMTIGDVISVFERKAKEYETVNYIYVVEPGGRLAGVFSVKELFTAPKAKKVSGIMARQLVVAHPHTHQERVALLAIDHNLKAIPVVDHEGRFLGVVPSDIILDILHNESIEDILRFAGIHRFHDPAEDIISASASTHFQKRLPWLVLGLLGGMVAAMVVGAFEAALQAEVLLAAFIPTVVYISDAVGTQTQTIFIRSMALRQKLDLGMYVSREAKVSLLIALVLAALGWALSALWHESALLAAVLGASIFATTVMAAAIAMALPWLFSKLNYDPAIASGPFATAIRDVLSILIYFLIATAMLGGAA